MSVCIVSVNYVISYITQKLDYMLFIVFARKWYHFSSDAAMQWLCILSNSFVAE